LQRNEEENALRTACIKEVAQAGSLNVTNETFNPDSVACPLVLHDNLSIPCQISTSKGNKNTRRVMSLGIMGYIHVTL
jgi:hypothetical protein